MIRRLRKTMDERDQGFTLIELLVVVLIIGVLAAIAIPVFLNQRKKGFDASVKSDLKGATTAAETYAIDNPTDPDFETQPFVSQGVNFANGGFRKSPGNTVHVFGGPAGGYCLRAYNPRGSGSGVAVWTFYDSLNGGIQPGRHTSGDNPCTVPGSSGGWWSL